jgi:hypothetical protein
MRYRLALIAIPRWGPLGRDLRAVRRGRESQQSAEEDRSGAEAARWRPTRWLARLTARTGTPRSPSARWTGKPAESPRGDSAR